MNLELSTYWRIAIFLLNVFCLVVVLFCSVSFFLFFSLRGGGGVTAVMAFLALRSQILRQELGFLRTMAEGEEELISVLRRVGPCCFLVLFFPFFSRGGVVGQPFAIRCLSRIDGKPQTPNFWKSKIQTMI